MNVAKTEPTFSKIAIATSLRSIADALALGKTFRVQINGRRVIVPDDLQLEVDTTDAGDIKIKLRWGRKRRTASYQR